MTDDGIRELHGLQGKPDWQLRLWEDGTGVIVIGMNVSDRRLTPVQARYVADALYRLAGRIERREAKAPEPYPEPEARQAPGEAVPGDDYLADKAERLAGELSAARKELSRVRHQLAGYKGHSVRWGRGHAREYGLKDNRGETATPEPAEAEAAPEQPESVQ